MWKAEKFCIQTSEESLLAHCSWVCNVINQIGVDTPCNSISLME